MISALVDAAASTFHLGILAVGPLSIFVAMHLLFARIYSSGSFKRDVYSKTFNTMSHVASLLSNPDSVLSREGVKASISGYETLFAGARKNVGETSTTGSIEHRAKEYQTMVSSFYDLVTDFYEWGWGQVSVYDCFLHCILRGWVLIFAWRFIRVFLHQSFHFAPRLIGETFEESIVRAEASSISALVFSYYVHSMF